MIGLKKKVYSSEIKTIIYLSVSDSLIISCKKQTNAIMIIDRIVWPQETRDDEERKNHFIWFQNLVVCVCAIQAFLGGEEGNSVDIGLVPLV